jgi:hypothetical protein
LPKTKYYWTGYKISKNSEIEKERKIKEYSDESILNSQQIIRELNIFLNN